MADIVRIANAGGYWGDDPYALRRQVLGELPIQYVSADFLAEITMSILQKQLSRDPAAGFARDFITQVEPLLPEVLARKIKIITNAGGVNPSGCAEALFAAARKRGIPLRVAVIEGDNIAPRLSELRQKEIRLENMETGESLEPYADRILSANAYFGALPVVEALRSDPDIVVSGRVTDTGITLAALIHQFGWSREDYNKLAHGIVGGHIIECGAQATGGNFTDWCKVPSFLEMGYPIMECRADGSFVVTKHPQTGGLVTCQTIREQLLYEMGHPQRYLTPDVIADFTGILLEQAGPDRVGVSGVRGEKPTDFLKVSVSLADGFQASGAIIVSGPDARPKAKAFAEIFWGRLGKELRREGMSDLESSHTDFVGDDSTHRDLTPSHDPTEILLRLAARDHSREKLVIFRKLLPSLILSGPSGVAVTGGAPVISEVVRYWPALIPQEHALPTVSVYEQSGSGGEPKRIARAEDLGWPRTGGSSDVGRLPEDPHPASLPPRWGEGPYIEVPLMRIAHARSGDKGDTANIGLIGRSPECYLWLQENVNAERVREWFASVVRGDVHRYLVPNLWAINFLLDESLGGGGTVSLFMDPQGKTYGQALLRCRVEIPRALLDTIAPENAPCPGELVP